MTDLIPPKKKYDLSIVEFLDYVTAQSQSERPLFSRSDVMRLKEIAGKDVLTKSPEKLVTEFREDFRVMSYTDIKDVLDGIWAARDKAFSELKEAA